MKVFFCRVGSGEWEPCGSMYFLKGKLCLAGKGRWWDMGLNVYLVFCWGGGEVTMEKTTIQ